MLIGFFVGEEYDYDDYDFCCFIMCYLCDERVGMVVVVGELVFDGYVLCIVCLDFVGVG